MYWAYGENEPEINKMRFKAKGLRPIYLLNPSFKKVKEENIHHWDVTMKEVSSF